MTSVYVLYTGGTIGGQGDPLTPMPGPDFERLVLAMPGLAHRRVQGAEDLRYHIAWTQQPLDSSNMAPADWVKIAATILSVYDAYDGFVILHGTDTLSWTASALSFLLRGLTKPVVVTGSQLPLAMPRSDAPRNLITAIILAGTIRVPEVCLFFDTQLLRGNRAVKVNAGGFPAFGSPNYPPLGVVGIEMNVDQSLILPPTPRSISLDIRANLLALQREMDMLATAVAQFTVISLVLFPGIQASMLDAIREYTTPPLKGIILGSFGEGNAPSNPDFLGAVRAAHDAGVVVVDGTQVLSGRVNIDAYETGAGLKGAGAISAYDLTPEAALTKLIYLTALGGDQASVERQMVADLRGEMRASATARAED
jgi:L-asparaginase